MRQAAIAIILGVLIFFIFLSAVFLFMVFKLCKIVRFSLSNIYRVLGHLYSHLGHGRKPPNLSLLFIVRVNHTFNHHTRLRAQTSVPQSDIFDHFSDMSRTKDLILKHLRTCDFAE